MITATRAVKSISNTKKTLNWAGAALLLLPFAQLNTMAMAVTPAQNLASLLAKTRTLQANFTQIIYDDQNRCIDQTKGVVLVNKPNQFRWHVKTPIEQLVLSDGKKMWNYNPDLVQVVITQIDKTTGATPLAILSGSSTVLSQKFKVTQHNSTYYLNVTERNFGFKKMVLQFSHGTITTLRLFDSAGQQTKISFSKVKLNRALKSSNFVFIAPPEVDIIQ